MNIFSLTFYVVIFRHQMEREIRHKIKKGDIADIPREVLDKMAPSLLVTPKGMFFCCCDFFQNFKVLVVIIYIIIFKPINPSSCLRQTCSCILEKQLS